MYKNEEGYSDPTPGKAIPAKIEVDNSTLEWLQKRFETAK